MEILKINFENGLAKVGLKDGKTAYIYPNNSGYYKRMLYTLAIEDEVVFTRGTMDKIRQYLYKLL